MRIKGIIFSLVIGLFGYWIIGLFSPSSVLAQAGTITGTVVDENGEPVAGATVIATIPGFPLDQPPTATSDSNGRFSMSVPYNILPGGSDVSYTVTATDPNGEQGSGVATISPQNPTADVVITLGAPSPYPSPSPGPYPSPPPPTYSPSVVHCDPNLTGDRDSRPYYDQDCDLCNATSNFCYSCATSFTVFDTVSWEWQDRDEECEGDAWVIKKWGGNITIDPTRTKIPFVGKKGEENEELYLADYFDGTNEYYEVANDYHQYWLDWVNHAGVLRKLTPMEYQDELKKEMVKRAQEANNNLKEGNIHNYELEYTGRFCWDFPFLADVVIAIAKRGGLGDEKVIDFLNDKAHYCAYPRGWPFDIDLQAIRALINAYNLLPLPDIITWGHISDETSRLASLKGNFPPEPDEENYVEKWQEWKKSEWGRLWEVVPMVSREDTPGGIYPYLGSKPPDTFIINNPDAQIERVPHVARLYETSQKIQNILLPISEGGIITQKKTAPILASAESTQPLIASSTEEKVLGEKTLLAQGCADPYPSLSLKLSANAPKNGVYDVGWKFCADRGPCGCGLNDFTTVISGSNGQGWTLHPSPGWGRAANGGCLSGGDAYTTPFSVHAQPGDTFTARVWVGFGGSDGGGDFCIPSGEVICTVTFTETGVSGDCIGGPPAPACGLPEALPVNQCDLTAIADSNPNDKLCCDKIEIGLDAVDMFDEYPYTPCEYDCPACVLLKDCPCNHECETPEDRTVSREIGINLSHPYLTPIWEQTTKADTMGIFNIFRPAQIPQFEDLDAASDISYTQTGFESIEPSTGEFYFNHLGGVQKAKEWVTTKVLMPYIED